MQIVKKTQHPCNLPNLRGKLPVIVPFPMLSFLLNMLRVGIIGFGGGSALIPVIEKCVVGRIDTEDNFNRDVTIASITPGALPVEIASGIGRRCFGRFGMMLGATAMALPGAILALIVYTLLYIYQNQSLDSNVVEVITWAKTIILIYILWILLRYIRKTIWKVEDKAYRNKSIAIMLVVVLLVCGKNVAKLLEVPLADIFHISNQAVFGLFFLGVIISYLRDSHSIFKKKIHLNVRYKDLYGDLLAWVGFLVVLALPIIIYFICSADDLTEKLTQLFEFDLRSIVSAYISFGGGDAYLAIADELFVSSGMLDEAIYIGQIIAVVNMLPGSILCKTLTSIGFFLGLSTGNLTSGYLFALAGFGCSVAASCTSFGIASYFYDSINKTQLFNKLNRWVRPVICGLLINVMLALVNTILKLTFV